MTKQHYDGGPAFPIVEPDSHYEIVHFGMTLRDWFAGQALMAIAEPDQWESERHVARWAYKMADAMLAARDE